VLVHFKAVDDVVDLHADAAHDADSVLLDQLLRVGLCLRAHGLPLHALLLGEQGLLPVPLVQLLVPLHEALSEGVEELGVGDDQVGVLSVDGYGLLEQGVQVGPAQAPEVQFGEVQHLCRQESQEHHSVLSLPKHVGALAGVEEQVLLHQCLQQLMLHHRVAVPLQLPLLALLSANDLEIGQNVHNLNEAR
jgi:hypothetical protein